MAKRKRYERKLLDHRTKVSPMSDSTHASAILLTANGPLMLRTKAAK